MSVVQESFLAQPTDLRHVEIATRNRLIISMRKVDGIWVVVSRFFEDVWRFHGGPTNVRKSSRRLDFADVPLSFKSIVKETMYRYMRRGRDGRVRPSTSALVTHMMGVAAFTHYLAGLGVESLSAVTPFMCANYAQNWKDGVFTKTSSPAPATIAKRLVAVEALFEFSQHSDDAIPVHPWAGSSAHHMSGTNEARIHEGRKTPLIPYNEFSRLFQAAQRIVEEGDRLLNLRDAIATVDGASDRSRIVWNQRRTRKLQQMGWDEGITALLSRITLLRTACYVVVASVSGCRNHEIAFLAKACCYSTTDSSGEKYWWMRSFSTKTDEGRTEWMIPEVAVKALEVMERWAAPMQQLLEQEINLLRLADTSDPRIAEAAEHLGALFVGVDSRAHNIVRTLSAIRWNALLIEFATFCGLTAPIRSHQFRRTFANYAARSQFGDLRYLKEHFKHWSLNMTLGYALNEDQEMSLYLEIQDELDDIKEATAADWLAPSAPLAGGYGSNLVSWRSRDENIVMFKSLPIMIRSIAQSTAIRSNGHAWCTSDNHDCSGNDTDPLRCGDDCSNAVVGEQHRSIYEEAYKELEALRSCDDIGPGGAARVERDLQRCRRVLRQLGHDPVGTAP